MYNLVMEHKTNQTFGIALKQIRKENGLTQEEFALRSGLGLHAVRNLEQGVSSLRLDKANQAFEFFGYELVPTKKGKGNN
jgi:transcriptional regulator with XRE-family HTH domain